jgi:hypothetical protein
MKRGSDVATLIPSRAGVECSVVVLEGLGPRDHGPCILGVGMTAAFCL